MKDKILVTGGSGMVGKDLQQIMPDAVYISSKDCDLTDSRAVDDFFSYTKPDRVVHLAARVGGITDNINKPAEYFDENILMNTNVIKSAHKFNVMHLIAVLSTCVYEDIEPHFKFNVTHGEGNLHSGKPAASNFSYAIAKRAMAAQIEAYNQQYGTKYSYLIPANLYGTNDNFDAKSSHFIPALVRKIVEAKFNKENFITIWGSGKPLRQSVYSMDFARVIKHCLENDIYENMNVAGNDEYSIMEIARTALDICGAGSFEIRFDNSKPDGQYRKTASTDFFDSTIPGFNFTPLYEGIREVYNNLVARENFFAAD